MVVTVQWEIAERLLASPGGKEYGALAVLVQALADVELIRKLPPSSFWPKPQVESAIVRIRPSPVKRARVADPLALRIFLRDLYAHRRKNLRGALLACPQRAHVKEAKLEVDAGLGKLGFDSACRAETLDVEQHLALFAVFGPPAGSRPLAV